MSDRETIEAWEAADKAAIECGTLRAEAAALRRDLSEALEVLREVEWGGETQCNVCFGWQYNHGHAPDCRLAAILAKYPGKEQGDG